MSAHTKTPPTEGQYAFAFLGPVDQVEAARAALQALGFVEAGPHGPPLVNAPIRPAGLVGDRRGLAQAVLSFGLTDETSAAPVPWREAFPALAEEERPGRMLRAARTRQDLTQMQLARLTGIPQRHLSAMEQGKRAIGKERAKKLADALQVDYRLFL